MKKKTTTEYRDAPADIEAALDRGERIIDFLPAPNQLVPRVEKQKVTILLNRESVDFFKRAAKTNGVKYQTMINNLLDSYAKKYSS